MKKMKTKNKCLVTSLAIVTMLMMSLGVKAQNVSIDLVHGSLLAAMTDAGETGSSQGFKALWRHEQLALSMTGTDRDGLTATGEVLQPSAVFGQRNGKIFISGGRRPSFIVVSLPKGYRITGYTLVLANDLVGANVGSGNFGNLNSGNGYVSQTGETEATMRFYEVKPWETDKTNSGTKENRGTDYPGYTDNQVRYLALGTGYNYVNNNPQSGGTIGTAQSDILATAANGTDTDINPSDSGKKFTISRTSTDANPMGNQIYFRLVKDYYYYGLTIESFEIRFSAEGTFTANVKPTEASETAVSMDASPFKTNKIDIGEMTNNTQPGTNNTQFSYVWGNVTDLDAYNYIYQDDAHENVESYGGDVPRDCATTKNIRKVNYNGELYYGLKNDIYFVEPPIEVENKAHNMVPIGYRIVGADINYASGSEKYYIQLYDRTGAKITGDDGLITVDTGTPSGSKSLGLLNNDAIKFEILGSGTNGAFTNTDAMAYITVTLYLQALNPYIDKMDIVCHDNRDVLQLTQTFTADNFSVAGDRFIFYVPEDYGNEWLNFTFSGLYSKYGDNTYYDGSTKGNARYSFVRSPYFITVDGDGDGGLYNNNAYSADHTYNDKVYTVDAGKYRFKFNNAEDLAITQPGQTTHGYLTEYPFSVSIYKDTKNPGDATAHPAIAPSEDKGTFIECKLHAQEAKSGTYYVFTADETRYNIAPTDGWQHRYYAFYRMEIELVAKTFTPDLTYTKIYDKTLYNDGTGDKEDSMWGLTLDVKDIDANTGKKVTGYLTYQEIIDHIKGREASGSLAAITSTLDPNNEKAPASMKQLLYIDGTPLYAMLNSSDGTTFKYLQDLQAELNPNALVFLPENTTSTLDNVAYETSTTASGTGLQAGKDIVLTDKIPFFTPYKIQVDAADKAIYRREQSGPNTFKLVDHATVVLPFTLSVSGGKHTNLDNNKQPTSDGFAFNLRTLKVLRTPVNNNYYEGDGYFDLYLKDNEGKVATQTMANQPYMVEVVQGESDDYSFVATQYGATIEPTPSVTDTNGKVIGVKNFESVIEKNVTTASLTSYGTYSGSKVPIENGIYYFNQDRFYCSTILEGKYTVVNVRPFRAYYSPTSVSATAKMTGFSILYDLFSDDGGITTSLTETSKPKVMTISTDRGSMLISAKENIQVNILSASGVNVDAFQMNAGEQRQVNVPSGIYIVNNTKILVK